jgi:hemerythrin-like domain-containing protein
MKTQDLVGWIREEHARVSTLAKELREKVGVVPRFHQGAWVGDVVSSFDKFRAHITQHMALEEDGGYLAPVREHRPGLSGEVDRLQSEHPQFIRLMDNLKRELDTIGVGDQLLIYDCCKRIESLLNYVEHHKERENLIVVSVFTDDIGTSD